MATSHPVLPESTAARAVGHALARAGIAHAFGVTGSGNFVATASLIEAGATFVAARHEAGAVTMADGYTRATGKVGLASVHQGPGLTNALTALTEAVKSRTPLVVLSGDTSDGAVRSNFHLPQSELIALLGAGVERLTDPASAARIAARTVARARAERRPIVLNLPLDVQNSSVAEDGVDSTESVAIPEPPLAIGADSGIDDLAAALAKAGRPVLLAGRGAWNADARAAVEKLRDKLGGVLATSAAAHGMFAGNPWSIGICGGFASAATSRVLQQADLVLGLGVSYTKWTTRHGTAFAPGATVVQVDHDLDALGADSRVDLSVYGEVGVVLRELESRVADRPPDQRWDTELDPDTITACDWHAQRYDDASGDGLIDPRTLSRRLDAVVPAERTVIIDGGHFVGFPSMYWRVPDPAAYLFTGAGFQSIGLGLGAAIGAALGRPDRTPVLAIGDGGLHLSLVELETLARLRLPVLVVVYHDSAYGAEVHHYRDSGFDLGLVRFPDTDLVALATGFGIEGVTVRGLDDLDVVGEWCSRPDRGPLLLDCKVVPTVVADYQAEAFLGH